MNISDKIIELRKNKLKISQQELADRTNVSRSTVRNWENGTSLPTTNKIKALSLLFEVSSDYLIYENHPLELSLYDIDNESYDLLVKLIDYLKL